MGLVADDAESDALRRILKAWPTLSDEFRQYIEDVVTGSDML